MACEFAQIVFQGRPVAIEYMWVGEKNPDTPVLVFLHEGLGSVSMWRDYPAQLCAVTGMRGLVFSRYGYGQSTARPASEEWLPDFMHRQARDAVPTFLQALGLWNAAPPVYLLGHSDGGSIALLLASMYPAQIAGVIAVAPHLFVEDISIASITTTCESYARSDLPQRLARHHAEPDSAFWGWGNAWLRPEFRAWNIEAEVSQIHCPVLAVQGVDDEYGTLSQIERIAQLLPQTTLAKLTDCGHSPHRDQSALLTQHVAQWLSAQREGTSSAPRVFSS
jgi:pimeloyl-ACP methyl ester carboxylesterase